MYLHCPVCAGGSRRKENDLVCGECYRRWRQEADGALSGEGGDYMPLLNWTATAIGALLPQLEKQRADAKDELDRLNEVIHDEVVAALQKAAKGRAVERSVWQKAFRTRKADLWAKRSGNAAFARLKTLEGRIAFGRRIIEDAAAQEVAAANGKGEEDA